MTVNSIKKNYILNLIKTVSGLLFPLVTFAYASRIIGAGGIGKVDYTRSIVSYFTLFATLGISTYGIREGAKARNDKYQLSKLVKELLIINLVTTIFAYIMFFGIIFMIPKFDEYRVLLLINGLVIGFTALGLEWLYGALENFEYITIRYVLFQFISLILLVVFVKKSGDYYVYAAIITFSNVGSNILNFVHARKYLALNEVKQFDLKKHIKPILVFFSNTLAGNIYVTLDTSMLGFLGTDYSVGLYSASIKMNRICVGIITSLSTVLLPRLSYYLSDGNDREYYSLLKRSFDFIIMLSLPLMGGLYLLSEEILVIFSGNEFASASTCARYLAFIILVISISTFVSSQILIPFGKEKHQLYSTILGSISNVIANSILIPILKQDGAAIGTLIAETIVALSTLCFATKCIDIRFIIKNTWHYIMAVAVMMICLFVVSKYYDGLIKCLICFFAGSFVYAVVLGILKDECFLYIRDFVIRWISKKE